MSAPLAVLAHVTELRVQRGGRAVLDGIDLTLHAGEVLAVVGPNGAGKSTLLKTLTGELRAQAGSVTMLGRPLAEWTPEALARVRAVLPQESALSFPFSALEVVMLGRTPHGGHVGAGAAEICRRALDAVGMGAHGQRQYPTLSGGERQRVQLARVLAQIWWTADAADGAASAADAPARLLFLDEPTASLDLAQQHRALGVARRFAREGVGVLAVLHDLNLAAQHADRVAVLADGRLAAIGAPESVLTPALVQSVFGMAVALVPHPHGGRPVLVPIAD